MTNYLYKHGKSVTHALIYLDVILS